MPADLGGLLISADPPPAAPQGGALASPLMLMGIFFLIFYFLVIRPQNKSRNEHQQLLASLKRGDRVVTEGGIVAVVHEVRDDRVVLEASERTRITVLKGSVKSRLSATDGSSS